MDNHVNGVVIKHLLDTMNIYNKYTRYSAYMIKYSFGSTRIEDVAGVCLMTEKQLPWVAVCRRRCNVLLLTL